MAQGLAISALLAICSAVSTLATALLKRKSGGTGSRLYAVFSFYLAVSLFLMSAVKYRLGYHRENIVESFWNLQARTLLHYGIPMLLIGAAVPFALHVLFRGKDGKIIGLFDSTLFFTLSFTFFFARKMNNRAYCAAFLAALACTVLAAVFLREKEAAYVHRDRETAGRAAVLLLYWLVTVVVYVPNELYLNNASDFPMSYWYFFGKLLLGGVVIYALLLAGALLYLTKRQFDLYFAALFILLTTGYLQGMFLNGSMGILDGTQKAWSVPIIIGNLAVWGILAGAMAAFCLWKKETAKKLMRIVGIWLVLTQLVSLGVQMVASAEAMAPKSEAALTVEGQLEVGGESNILVFVLDKFDGRVMDEILAEDADFLSPLEGFTYYPNTTSEFSPTEDSIPYLLSGTKYRKGTGQAYVDYAYQGESLLADIHEAGYDIGVYTNMKYVSGEMWDRIGNYAGGVERTCGTRELFSLMTQCSRYKLSPFAAKNYYLYDTSDIELLVVDDTVVNIENDVPFYNRLAQEGLTVGSDTRKAFRFMHMHGAHPPYTMTEEFQYLEYDARRDEHWGSGISQAKGAMKIVYEYIRQLKELGKYEDALIVITSDHGSTDQLSDRDGNMVEISFPILFVKEPGSGQAAVRESQAPVCHADVLSTIQDVLGADGERRISEIGVQERIRYLMVSVPGFYEKYEINGDVRQIENWKFIEKGK